MEKKIITFGEIMLRISPADKCERIKQAKIFKAEPGGSESNVAIALAQLGHKVDFITKIPDNHFKNVIFKYLNQHEVGAQYIAIGAERLGIYWTENGIGIRASQVIYDRENSSFSNFKKKDFNWCAVNNNASWFHTSGITPAISKNSCKNIVSIVNSLDEKIEISIDLNYRNKLWNWIKGDRKKEIKNIMNHLCQRAHLITANETDLQNMLGFPLKEDCDITEYGKVADDMFSRFSGLNFLAISLRASLSASVNDWTGLLFARTGSRVKSFKGPAYRLDNIADRVGTGDSFTAGIIHGIQAFKNNFQHVIDFAVVLSALNHTVLGDASQFSEKDIEDVIKSKASGRIIR